ncbi:TPA: hypothetical protein RG680_001381 [Morganella morganii]|uniref:hypothetical protein n=1 Tax=Morganella morganii TaxID=582 RepID=UPI001BDA009C|nr:hypothetical protein [Morganella morganii]EKW8485182.1 hypothetical protein [Morganella morganii]MBT0375697.1 hypothetical protein [Morganella morganii subsp. morganii]HCR3991623.1 hypothetical protein [Morganella morganii]HDS2909334.1 hypothetical protein [Morganella morganii subsp. morganii]HDS7248580.1 hypothetical protein [Morganella morganii subsp. morganii]
MKKAITILLNGWVWAVLFFGLWMFSMLSAEQTESQHKDKVITDQQKVIDNAHTSIDIFDRVATANANRNVQAEAKSQEKQIEYRTIIRKEATCNLYIPQPVSDGLLSHVYTIRESAMRSAPGITDTTGTGTTATRRLTYCQAVEWIEPLLTALDKANGQLMDIRKADTERSGKPR